MKMWSKGLGNKELVVDFKKYKVVEEVNQDIQETVLKGVTIEPVQWEFHARLCKDDLSGILNIFFKPATLLFVIKNVKIIILFFYERIFKSENFSEVEVK